MRLSSQALLLASSALVSAHYIRDSEGIPAFSGDPFKKYSISAKGINATFIPYGARLTSLYVQDKNGVYQDVAVGYDDAKDYLKDSETSHTYFGAVVGRYANRIKNGTFTLPDGTTSHIPENEHGGLNTLHGGFTGYDQQNWTVAAHTACSLTFTFLDHATSGFPGDLLNIATYTLSDDAAWTTRLVSIPLTAQTPVMLSNHVYWNLGAFVTAAADTVLNNTLHMPYAKRIIPVDSLLIPTGALNGTANTPFDFTSPKSIGQDILAAGGYDNAFILDRPARPDDPDLTLWAPSTGIALKVETNQEGLQIYTCGGQNGTIPVKQSQQHNVSTTTYVEKNGCIVIETQDWIDGINNPQWAREEFQIFSPTTLPAVNWAKYSFSVQDAVS